MPTKGENQNFFNTKDPITTAQFDQEVELWLKAYNSATARKPSLMGVIRNGSLVLNFIGSIIFLIGALIRFINKKS